MVEKLSTQVTIPAWLVTLVATLFITVSIFQITQVKAQQAVNTRVDLIEKVVDKKANQSDVDKNYDMLKTINQKLDLIMMKQQNK